VIPIYSDAVFTNGQVRLGVTALFYEDDGSFGELASFNIFFNPNATVQQIESASGAAAREVAMQQFGKTIPSNDVIIMGFARA
jgi:hypothetical protein